MSRNHKILTALAITVSIGFIYLFVKSEVASKPKAQRTANPLKEEVSRIQTFSPEQFLEKEMALSAETKEMLSRPLGQIPRQAVLNLKESEIAFLVQRYLSASSWEEREKWLGLLAVSYNPAAFPLFQFSLENEYLGRSSRLGVEEMIAVEHLTGAIGVVAARDDAAYQYLQKLANPWVSYSMISNKNLNTYISAIVTSRAMQMIGATGRPDAYEILVRLRNGALVDPISEPEKARSFVPSLIAGARLWDSVTKYRETYPNWMREGFVDAGENHGESIQSNDSWSETERGRSWMEWRASLPAGIVPKLPNVPRPPK